MSTQTVVYSVVTSMVVAGAVVTMYGASSSSETTNYETSQLRQEFNDLKRSISAASSPGFKARPSRGGEDLPPILRMFGKAPRNLPSTVKRNPKPNEGKWGNGKDQYYDGRTDAKHLGGSTGVDTAGISPGLWNFMLKALNVRSVVDVGCGRGISTKWFLEHGADVLCLEGANDAIAKSYLPKERVVAHDFSLGPYWPDKTYDMAWCIEVLEHIARPYMANYQSIFHKAAIIVASHSAWGGHHHVEVHPDWWWVTRMELAGFVYSDVLTRLVRKLANHFKTPRSTEAQHIIYTSHVYINPKVSSLPEHSHLMGMLGCFASWPAKTDGKLRQQGPCPDPEDALPDRFMPVHRTPTQYDQFTLNWDFGQSIGHTATSKGAVGDSEFDLTLTNDPSAKCRSQTWPGPTADDGCAYAGKPFNPANLLNETQK